MVVDASASLRDTVLGVQAIIGTQSSVEDYGRAGGQGRGTGLLIG
jgi:hypothetical protein